MTGPQSIMWMAILILTGLAPVRGTSILQIAGGNVVQEGSDVAIECKCGGHGPDIVCWEYPMFEINGIPLSGGVIADGRYPGYSIAYNFFSQVFKLTAHNVSRGQNGSTYQCGLKDHDGDVILRSNTVTMIVTSRHAEYSVTDSTRQQTSTTVNFVSTHSSDGVAGDIQMLPTSLIAPPPSPSHITNITSSSYHQTPSTTSTPPAPATTKTKTTSETIPKSDKEDDAPTYVYVAVGSGVGIVVYILTIVLIGLVISLKIKEKKARLRVRGYQSPVYELPMVSNPVYSEVVSPSAPAPPYFKVDPCQFGDRQIVVNMDTRYHDVPQRKSVAAESLYDYIDMQ